MSNGVGDGRPIRSTTVCSGCPLIGWMGCQDVSRTLLRQVGAVEATNGVGAYLMQSLCEHLYLGLFVRSRKRTMATSS